MKVATARDGLGRRKRSFAVLIRILGIIQVGFIRLPHGLRRLRIPTRQRGVVEQAEREVVIVRHGDLLVAAAARARPLGAGEPNGHGWIGRGAAYAATGIGSGASDASPSSAIDPLGDGSTWLFA